MVDAHTYSARLSTRTLAARKIIEEHIDLTALVDNIVRLEIKALCDMICNDSKALSEFVHEAKDVLIMANGRANEEETRGLRALVKIIENGSASQAPGAFLAPLEEILRDR